MLYLGGGPAPRRAVCVEQKDGNGQTAVAYLLWGRRRRRAPLDAATL
ncbi:MAG: hypothetical protein GY803_16070 [Chloroflexi bacterium]|nr:hypothetical protein [Chloroflexota bacterium]